VLAFKFLLDNKRLTAKMWYKVVESGERGLAIWQRGAENVEPVGIRPNSTTDSPNRLSLTEFCATFASVSEACCSRDFAFAQETRECSRSTPRSFGAKCRRLRMTN